MIVEERTYTLKPGQVKEVLARVENEGIAIQASHLGRLLGYFWTETGDLNQIVQMWGYDSWEERERRRTALWSDPKWIAFDKQMQPYIVHMRNRLLRPAAFSPIR